MPDNEGRFAMADQGEKTYHVVGGALGIRGAAWTLPTAISAFDIQAAIRDRAIFTADDRIALLAGRLTGDARALVLLFVSNLSGAVLGEIHHLITGSNGSAIRDWDTIPAELLGRALQLLLRDVSGSPDQRDSTWYPHLLLTRPSVSGTIGALTEENEPCSECGAPIVRRGIGYICLNCGARHRYYP